MPVLRYLPNVATLELDPDRCNGCRMCAEVCPQTVFTIENKKARISSLDSCMECGACAMNCEAEAISVRSGVGCAAGILEGLRLGTEPTCDGGCDSTCC